MNNTTLNLNDKEMILKIALELNGWPFCFGLTEPLKDAYDTQDVEELAQKIYLDTSDPMIYFNKYGYIYRAAEKVLTDKTKEELIQDILDVRAQSINDAQLLKELNKEVKNWNSIPETQSVATLVNEMVSRMGSYFEKTYGNYFKVNELNEPEKHAQLLKFVIAFTHNHRGYKGIEAYFENGILMLSYKDEKASFDDFEYFLEEVLRWEIDDPDREGLPEDFDIWQIESDDPFLYSQLIESEFYENIMNDSEYLFRNIVPFFHEGEEHDYIRLGERKFANRQLGYSC